MAESRVFRKAEGITIEGIGRSVQNFLRSSKGLVVQGGKAGEGYVVQAKEDDSWKKVAGMSSAIEVQISDTGSGILVNIGNGQWSDKIGAGVLGWFVFAPLAVTAIVGSVQQKKLPGEIFDHIERYVASGGNDLYLGTDFVNASNGNIICPHCKNEVPAGNAFCTSCGKPLTRKCPSCNEDIALNMAFCPKCGADMNREKTVNCISCGAQLPVGSLFCKICGAKQVSEEKVCPKCGKPLKEDDVFCSGCGEKVNTEPALPEKLICPDCGKELEPDSKFCSKCGHKF